MISHHVHTYVRTYVYMTIANEFVNPLQTLMSVLVGLMDVTISVITLLVVISALVMLDMPQHQITNIALVSILRM